MNQLMLFEKNEQAVVSSRVIAERFGKEHKNVVRDVEKIVYEISSKLSVSYVMPATYRDSMNRKQTEYLLTRDGFSLLVMGFTGPGALQWKIKYIEAFNRMEQIIRERQTSEWLITRRQGKLCRRNETDAIAQLIPYAEKQGSRNMAKQAYTIYTKLVHSLVGIEAGQRDRVPFKTLSTIMFLEDIIQHTILEGIEQGVYYKEIYSRRKANGEQFVCFAYLPSLSA